MNQQSAFVTCPSGLEELLTQELKDLGVRAIRPGFRGVYIPCDLDFVYRINYGSRLAMRVLWPLMQFPCRDRNDLYDGVRRMRWHDFLTPSSTFSIDATVSHPEFSNSHFAALVVKDAICDQMRDRFNARPSIELKKPDVQLNLFIQKGVATINLDTSLQPLHKRGWRTEKSVASLQETLAAALLVLKGYHAERLLCDPFCGSGTFLIEAALLATKTPPGYLRTPHEWGFTRLSHFREAAWMRVKDELDSQILPLRPGMIMGADKDPQAISATLKHLENAGFKDQIRLQRKDIRSYYPPSAPELILTNPPYGKRLSTSIEIYDALHAFLKTKAAPHARCHILAPDSDLICDAGFTVGKTVPLFNGGLEVHCYSVEVPLPVPPSSPLVSSHS